MASLQRRSHSCEIKFDPKLQIDPVDEDLEAQMKPAARQFDVDMILGKVDRKMAGESNSSSSESEEPQTANHESVRLEEKFSKSPPKMISM